MLLPVSLAGCFTINDPETSNYLDMPKRSPTATVAEAVPSPDNSVLLYEDETPVMIWKAGNDGAIEGGNGTPPTVSHDQDYYVTQVCTYHWNDGAGGTTPGIVSLQAADGTVFGPWQTELVNNVYWCTTPNLVIPAGRYTLTDSDPATWAQNGESGGTGMGWAYGVPAQ
jgi:hypothetical protein